GQHFDRHQSVQLHLAREVDDPHPPAAELALERILAGERFLQIDEFAVDHARLLEVVDRVKPTPRPTAATDGSCRARPYAEPRRLVSLAAGEGNGNGGQKLAAVRHAVTCYNREAGNAGRCARTNSLPFSGGAGN